MIVIPVNYGLRMLEDVWTVGKDALFWEAGAGNLHRSHRGRHLIGRSYCRNLLVLVPFAGEFSGEHVQLDTFAHA